MSALKDLREAEIRNPESEALDAIADLVSEVFPKGTTDPWGRAIRHQLHKTGRLNMVRNWPARERLSQSLHAAANLVAGDRDANGIANSVHDLERQLRELHVSEYRR
jgi:hypothetical protein